MAITYQDPMYAIPANSWNKYNRWSNQRKAAGINVPYSDQAAFWEGQMEGITNRAAQAALRREEQNRFNQTLEFQKDTADKNRSAQMFSGLAAIPATYMMYKGLGIGEGSKEFSDTGVPLFSTKGLKPEQVDALRDQYNNNWWNKGRRYLFGSNEPSGMSPIPAYGYDDLGIDASALNYGASSASYTPSYASYGIPDSSWAMNPDLYEFGDFGTDIGTFWDTLGNNDFWDL